MRVSSSMPGAMKSLLIPANRGLGDALVEEALRQPGISLHDLRERMSAIDGLAGLLQLANGFIEQAHFAEGDAEVVMGLRILFSGGRAGFKILFQLAEHLGEIDASVFTEGRRLGGGWCAGNDRRNVWSGQRRPRTAAAPRPMLAMKLQEYQRMPRRLRRWRPQGR